MKPKITDIMKRLRIEMKEMPGDLNIPDIYFEEARRGDGYTHILMPLVALKTSPCAWLKSCGGCSMCGYQMAASLNKIPTKENIINQTKYVIQRLPSRNYPLITFSSSGSFLDPKEIDDSIRPILLRMLKDAGYQEFNFECRPEFLINEKRVAELKEYFNMVSVGMGLESSDDFIRNHCLNKGTTKSTYQKASDVLNKYKVDYDAYVQMGKPFLTTREDIEDAVQTTLFAFEHGFGRVFLMLCNIQPFTVTHFLWKKGKFYPPMLWSAIEVLKRLPEKQRSRVYIKGFNRAVPTPITFPRNCDECTGRVADTLTHWNLTGDYGHIENIPPCECINDFYKKLEFTDKEKLSVRLDRTLNWIEREMNIQQKKYG